MEKGRVEIASYARGTASWDSGAVSPVGLLEQQRDTSIASSEAGSYF